MHYSSILETANHFRCIDIIIDRANGSLSENLIKELHLVLKTAPVIRADPSISGWKWPDRSPDYV